MLTMSNEQSPESENMPPSPAEDMPPPPPAPAAEETPPPAPAASPAPAPAPASAGKDKKMLAGILGIVLGAYGVHKFILGYKKEGIIMAVIGVVGWFLCGVPTLATWIVGIIEGIMYLTKSDEEFENTYIKNQKPWF
jgi:TM2 domain-containing membrane protein YozV